MNTEKENQELTPEKILQDVLYYISYSGRLDDRVTTEKARDRIIKYGQRMYDEGEKNSKQQSKWIPVEERLPDTDELVLVTDRGVIEIQCYVRERNKWSGAFEENCIIYSPTHWQPSPDLPEQGKEK